MHQVAAASAACSCVHPWRSRSFETRELHLDKVWEKDLRNRVLDCLFGLAVQLGNAAVAFDPEPKRPNIGPIVEASDGAGRASAAA